MYRNCDSFQQFSCLTLPNITIKQVTALERGRKVEELQKRLLDSEVLRTRCTRKVNLLKDQVSFL